MTEIKKIKDEENKITIYTVSGKFLFDQIIDLIKKFYIDELTLNVIFDLTNADMSAITAGEIERIVEISSKYAHLREGGKTAFISSSDLSYGLTRMYEVFAEIKNHPVTQGAFKNLDDAISWIIE